MIASNLRAIVVVGPLDNSSRVLDLLSAPTGESKIIVVHARYPNSGDEYVVPPSPAMMSVVLFKKKRRLVRHGGDDWPKIFSMLEPRSARARHGFQQMPRLPCYRGWRTR